MVKIMGKYEDQPWEEIDEFDTRKEAMEALREYRLAYGAGWLLRLKSV